MEEIVASVDNIKFDIELALKLQVSAEPLPFPRMDKSAAAVCESYLKGTCWRGQLCPFKHIKGDRTVVCKHWLRGLCKKGDECEFLHQYDMTKMPECHFYKTYKECSNRDCLFLHIDPEAKIKDCPWYDRGFCRHGPNCRYRHTRRIMCPNYFAGFCIDGPDCKFKHPTFNLPDPNSSQQTKKTPVVCHFCRQRGHKAFSCPNTKQGVQDANKISTEHESLAQATQSVSKTETMHSLYPSIVETVPLKCRSKGKNSDELQYDNSSLLRNARQSRSQTLDFPPGKTRCQQYDAGFCGQGPNCPYRHIRRIICPN